MNEGRVWPMDAQATTLSAVEVLPSELWLHVFVLGVESPDDSYTAPINFELSVCHVSRRWRAVSVDTQELWGQVSTKMPLDRVSTYVDRSKACILSILIRPSLDTQKRLARDDDFPQYLESFLQIVDHTAPRWYRLIVWTFDHAQMTQVLDRVLRLSVPRLEALVLTQGMNDAPSDPVSGDIFGSFLSCAHSLTLARFYLVHLPWISFSMNNLRQIDICGVSQHVAITFDQLRQVLTVSPRLVKLALMGAFPDLQDDITYPQIVLPALEFLRISSLNPPHADLSIFYLLSTPVLKSLEIANVYDLNGFISDINTTLLKYPFVTSLALNDISLPLENSDIFSAFQSVSYFDALGSTAVDMFASWSCQAVVGDEGVAWPDLRVLAVDGASCSAMALTWIIKFRMRHGKPLRILRVTEEYWNRFSPRLIQWFLEHVTVQIITLKSVTVIEGLDGEGFEGVDSEVDSEFEFDPYEDMDDFDDPLHEDDIAGEE